MCEICSGEFHRPSNSFCLPHHFCRPHVRINHYWRDSILYCKNCSMQPHCDDQVHLGNKRFDLRRTTQPSKFVSSLVSISTTDASLLLRNSRIMLLTFS